MKKRFLAIVAAFAACLLTPGCSAYNGLIGHPLHVLHQQHEYNEQHATPQKNHETPDQAPL